MSKIIKCVSVKRTPVVINAVVAAVEQEVFDAEEAAPSYSHVLQMAQQEAEAILNNAAKQADDILRAAAAEAEAVKQQAYAQGHKQGFQQGLSEGRAEAKQEMQTQLTQAIKNAQDIILTAKQQAQQMAVEAEQQIIELSLAIARKIVAAQFAENADTIVPIVKAALEKVRQQEQVAIRVNPDNFAQVLAARSMLQQVVGREQGLTILTDQTIAAGGCVIDTPYGMVDARLDTQFELIRKALQEVQP